MRYQVIRTDPFHRFRPGRIHKAERLKLSPDRGGDLDVVRRKVAEAEAAGVVPR